MNEKILAGKQSIIDEITEQVKSAKSVSIVEYRGLSVSKLEALRKDLRKEEASVKVYKNTFVIRALKSLGIECPKEQLEGPNAFVFSNKDEVSAPKILVKYAKKNEEVVLKGALMDGKVLNAAELKTVASLPGKEGMLSMLLSCLTSPIRGFACAVKAVADKQAE